MVKYMCLIWKQYHLGNRRMSLLQVQLGNSIMCFRGRLKKKKKIIRTCYNRQDRHKYAVTSVGWYPFDTGMFVTSSYDTTIKVWDTNTMKVISIESRELLF